MAGCNPVIALVLVLPLWTMFLMHWLIAANLSTHSELDAMRARHASEVEGLSQHLQLALAQAKLAADNLEKASTREAELRSELDGVQSHVQSGDKVGEKLQKLKKPSKPPAPPLPQANVDGNPNQYGEEEEGGEGEGEGEEVPAAGVVERMQPPPSSKKKKKQRIRGGQFGADWDATQGGAALLIFTHTRAAMLGRTLDSVFRYIPPEGFPITISQDGHDASVKAVVAEKQELLPITHLHYKYDFDESLIPEREKQFRQYFRISQHYKWALTQVFNQGVARVIILEDDMEVASDFFSYFAATIPLLDDDPSLMCVSAWNDNGRPPLSSDPRKLYRTDCFPGLGWMLTRALWDELLPKWPGGFWDDWLREPAQRKERSCIFPEVNRVYTFGEAGTSGGQFFNAYLRNIHLNDEPVTFDPYDIQGLDKGQYDEDFFALLKAAKSGQTEDAFIVTYSSIPELDAILGQDGAMKDHKAGIPRTSYMGVVVYRSGEKRKLVVPKELFDTL